MLRNLAKSGNIIFVGFAISILLILIFGLIHASGSEFLDFPIQWLGVALMPFLLSFFAAGYITSFKGFGIELEAALNASVKSTDITVSSHIADFPLDEKQSLQHIFPLFQTKRENL